jgi:hypothetical protein
LLDAVKITKDANISSHPKTVDGKDNIMSKNEQRDRLY